jgi:hypothetical protein
VNWRAIPSTAGDEGTILTTRSGDPMGQALNQNQRFDTPSVRGFLDDLVTLP